MNELTNEANNLKSIFRDKKNLCEYDDSLSTRPEDLADVIRKKAKEIHLFHFGGHSDGYQIVLNDDKHGRSVFYGGSLVFMIKDLPNLKLVFLNGCKSAQMADELFEAGVPIVIGTTENINDKIAAELSINFYQNIASQMNIAQSWELAKNTIVGKYKTQAELRALYWEDDDKEEFIAHKAWFIRMKEGAGDWKLVPIKETNFPDAHNISRTPLSHQIIGRKKDLEKVRQMLLTHQQCAVVNGMGGIGKSTLARYYIQQYHAEYQHIIWLHENKDVYEIFFADLLLLDNLGIKAQIFEYLNQSNKNAAIHLLMQTLNKLPKPALLILDNVQDLAQLDQLLSPLDKSVFHVLITSRQEKGDFHFHSLDTLEKEDAKDLFCLFYLGTTDTNAPKVIALKTNPDLDRILTRAAYHTLTIELLAKILRASNTLTLASLANRLEEQLINPSLKQKIATKYTSKEATLYEIILFAFDISNIRENKDTFELLMQWSVLPSFSIPQEVLFMLLGINEENMDNFDISLSFLVENGWIQKDIEEGNSYFCHAIIQEAVREQKKIELELYKKVIINLGVVMSYIQKENSLNNQLLLPYANNLLLHINDKNDLTARLMTNIAMTYSALGNYNKQLDTNLQALNIFKEIYPTNISDISALYNNLSVTYLNLGNYAKSLEYGLNALDICEIEFTCDEINLAGNYHTLAIVYSKLKKYKEEQTYNLKSLEIHKKILPKDDILFVIIYNNIAISYMNVQNYDEALKSILLAQKICKDKSLNEHPQLAVTYHNLADIYGKLGKTKKRRQYHLKALEIRKNILDKYHPDIARSYNNLAEAYGALGENKERLKYHLKALEIREKSLSQEHPLLVLSYTNIAHTYAILQNYMQSLFYYKKAIIIQKQYLINGGYDIEDSVDNMNKLLNALIYIGKASEIEDYIIWFQKECKEYIQI